LGPVRASRLVGLLGLLQARGRMTAKQLAAELEVSQRTILRDIEALSGAGIPVYAVRGAAGGFQLLDGFSSDLPAAQYRRDSVGPHAGARQDGGPHAEARQDGGPHAEARRARVRLSPRGRRLAALLGRPSGIRIRRNVPPVAGREDWVEASVRIDSISSAVLDMLALGAEVEVVHPAELRTQVGETARKLAELHADNAPATDSMIAEYPRHMRQRIFRDHGKASL
jgi:predicted DNA-binding transcriptional regulator YafY